MMGNNLQELLLFRKYLRSDSSKNRRDRLNFSKDCLVHRVCTPQQYERLSVYVNSGLTEGTSSQLGAAPCCPAPLEGLTACLPAEGPLISERLHRHRARHERERGGGSRWGRPAAPGRHLASGAGLGAALGAASSRFPLPRSPGRQVRAGGGAFLRSASSRRRSPPRPARVKL